MKKDISKAELINDLTSLELTNLFSYYRHGDWSSAVDLATALARHDRTHQKFGQSIRAQFRKNRGEDQLVFWRRLPLAQFEDDDD